MSPLRPRFLPSALAAAVTAAVVGVATAQQGPIYDLAGYRTVDDARAMATADLDGDGVADVVVVGPGELVTMLATEGGQFLRRASAPIGADPRDVTLHDIDGDGLLDAIVCDGASDTVRILRGHGSGVFTPLHDLPTGRTPVAALVGDLDGDGLLDLAVVNFDHYFVGYYPGLAGGGFGPAERLRVGFQPSRGWMVDVDGDGDLDIVTFNQGEATVSVLANDGAGEFAETVIGLEGAPLWAMNGRRSSTRIAAGLCSNSVIVLIPFSTCTTSSLPTSMVTATSICCR